MSYRCQECNESQMGCPEKVVTKMRTIRSMDTSKIGSAIVKEIDCCPPCVEAIRLRLQKEEELSIMRANDAQEAKLGQWTNPTIGQSW